MFTVSFFICAAKRIQDKYKVLSDSLLIYVSCSSCQLEIVLPVLQINTKTILSTRSVQRTDFKFWLIFNCNKSQKYRKGSRIAKKKLETCPNCPNWFHRLWFECCTGPPRSHFTENSKHERRQEYIKIPLTFSSSAFFYRLIFMRVVHKPCY